jgi:hypothetical protein
MCCKLLSFRHGCSLNKTPPNTAQVEPAINALPANCAGNIACACGDSAFITSLIPTVTAACSPSDLQSKSFPFSLLFGTMYSDAISAAAIQVASQLCLENGVTLVIPSATSSSGPVSTPPVVSPSVVPASTTPVYTSTPVASTPVASAPVASSSAVYVPPVYSSTPSAVPPPHSVQPYGNSSITTPPITSFTGAADQIKGSWAAAGILGLGALLMGL